MPKNKEEFDDQFGDMQEVRTSAIKWGAVGDWFKGTLIANDREVANTLSDKGEMQKIFEFKMKGGSFHGIKESRIVDDTPTIIEEGSFWSVFAKPGLATQLRNAKLGQIVGMRFTEEKPASKKGYNPTKVIKVYLGEMDSTYQGEQGPERPSLED